MGAFQPGEPDPTLAGRRNRAWREVAGIDAAFERGEIDAEGWHRATAAIFVPAYLAGGNPRAQYVPIPDRPRLVRHLLAEVVEPGGRLIVGMNAEEVGSRTWEDDAVSWGFPVAGRSSRDQTRRPAATARSCS